jgi:FkbM family methyltransferase
MINVKILDLINTGDLVFDVGSNVGIMIDAYLLKGARVVGFEANPILSDDLRKKYSGNKNVSIVNVGLADMVGYKEFMVCSKAPNISTFSNEWMTGRFSNYHWDQSLTVEITILDEMIKTYGRPKFCKIDVEGFEYEVLNGLSSVIPYLSFEFTIEFMENARKCVSYLQTIGYKQFNVGIAESDTFLMNWVGSDELFSILSKINDSDLWGDIYASV